FKAKGWKRERKEFGDTMCEVYVPPPSVKDELITTGCFTARKDTAVSVAAQSKTAVPVENVRTLIDKATGRLRRSARSPASSWSCSRREGSSPLHLARVTVRICRSSIDRQPLRRAPRHPPEKPRRRRET